MRFVKDFYELRNMKIGQHKENPWHVKIEFSLSSMRIVVVRKLSAIVQCVECSKSFSKHTKNDTRWKSKFSDDLTLNEKSIFF